MPLIDANEVESLFMDCLFTDEEVAAAKRDGYATPVGAVVADGIQNKFGFHPIRLESHRDRVAEWLKALPSQFQQNGGGGWSFLNACNDRNGEQWTGFHQRMDQLFSLGVALGLAKAVLPREMWDVLPGGMPYYVVTA